MLRLWRPGHLILRIRFSPGGRWLVYDDAPLKGTEPDVAHSVIYHVDLRESDLKPEKLSDGSMPLYSPSGDLAFFTTRKESLITGAYNLHIFRADGTLMTAKQEAFLGTLSWSPDGRWLAYQKLDLTQMPATSPASPTLLSI